MRRFERRATAAHGIKRLLIILVAFLAMKCSRDEVDLAGHMRCPIAFPLAGANQKNEPYRERSGWIGG
jgi:hypothetical protein